MSIQLVLSCGRLGWLLFSDPSAHRCGDISKHFANASEFCTVRDRRTRRKGRSAEAYRSLGGHECCDRCRVEGSCNILFAVDRSARTTTVGKQRRQRASSPPAVERALPDGCEGAFSPYAEPARAQVIGRCVSGVFPSTNALT